MHFTGFVFQSTLASVNIQVLPDKGQKLLKQIQELEEALSALALSPEPGKVSCVPELRFASALGGFGKPC